MADEPQGWEKIAQQQQKQKKLNKAGAIGDGVWLALGIIAGAIIIGLVIIGLILR